jgi:hypothetical protein
MRLIVLSKTHARVISTGTQARHDLSSKAHISFGICQTMMSSQVQPGQHGVRVRLNPSFTMSKHSQPKPVCNCFISIARKPIPMDGGARRDRTDDLMLAKHPLYQLSYGPHYGISSSRLYSREMVGPDRLELSTLRLSGVRSNHLSYGPAARKCTERPLGSR